MNIIEADSSLKIAIDNFYHAQGYHGCWSDSERAFVCIVKDTVIGAVKVELINNVAILRGMYIDKAFQGQGLGRRFLKYIEPILNQYTAYCMPLTHAKDFYKLIKFIEIPEQESQEFLQYRCQQYREAGYSFVTMCRTQQKQ